MADQNNRITRKMHLQLNCRIKPLALIVSVALLASCASSPERAPVEIEDRDIITENTSLEPVDSDSSGFILDTAPLQAEELNVSKGDFYRQQANNTTDLQSRINDALSAAEYYIQGNDFDRVEQAISELPPYPLDPVQQDRLTVIRAYVLHARGKHQLVLSMLRPLWQRIDAPESPSLDQTQGESDDIEPLIPATPTLSTQQVDALLLASFSFQALNDYDSALDVLIERERSLYGKARSETTRYIWQIVNSLPVEQRQNIIQTTQNDLVQNRLEQSFDTQVGIINEAPQQFNQWREESLNQGQKQAFNTQWNSRSAKQIAVLLPISSKFNKAAIALKDGIMQQHDQNQSPFRPALQFYDIGDQALQAPQYYNAAIRAGADFIIGPLGKDYANQINNYGGGRAPTLLLGGDTALSSNTTRFDLSPEIEGQRIAERAWKEGHLSAAIMLNDTNHSRRSVEGFSNAWLSLGGKISKTIYYSPTQFDHSVELKQLFNINQSKSRHTQLSRTLGFKPKFSAYHRNDIDFIFMLADAKTGRLVRPQINFYSGSKVPVFSTSKIFNGIQDTVNNVDLDDTQFPIMPWVFKSAEVAPYAGQLNQLFALGSDAYTVAGNYEQLRTQSNSAINGSTGLVSINEYGEVVNQPVWASFSKGEVVAIDSLGLDITLLAAPNDGAVNPNVKGNYNGNATHHGNSKTYNASSWNKDKDESWGKSQSKD